MNTVAITLLLSFAIVIAVIAAMGIGVMNGRGAIRGSCGGLNNGRCELCSNECRKGKSQ
jgi:hypothetical protein